MSASSRMRAEFDSHAERIVLRQALVAEYVAEAGHYGESEASIRRLREQLLESLEELDVVDPAELELPELDG